MMAVKLILYIDTNMIVPVSCDAAGRTHETEPVYYSKSIDYSHIDTIRNFYQHTTGVSRIDTHFVFAEVLETSVRKQMIQEFRKEGFSPISFTLLPSIILTEYALKQGVAKEAFFGESVAIIFSNDDTLRLTGTVYDGNSWQWNANYTIIPKVGDSPLKYALVECLITERDKNLSTIDERNREREIQYQMQFADEWLTRYKRLGSHDDLVVDFKFSFEDTSVKLRLSKSVIEQYYEQTLAPAITRIADHKESAFSQSVKYAVLVGPAFDEENFISRVQNALDCQDSYCVIPYARLSSVLAACLVKCDVSDDFSRFDQISAQNSQLYRSNIDWIQYARSLTDFNEKLGTELKELSKRVAEDTQTLENMITAVNICLSSSAFDQAREALGKTLFPSILAKNSIQEARSLLAQKGKMEGIFAKLESVDGARLLINRIRENAEKITNQIAASESHQSAIHDYGIRIAHYEEHYGEYLALRREFDMATEYKRKKELVLKMKEITMEPLPELNLRQVFAEIKYSREKEKVGLFKKKEFLHVTVSVKNGDHLPCAALLNISNKVQIRASEGDAECLAFEIAKGESTFSVVIERENSPLDFSKPIYCYLFVDKGVMDKSAIKCDRVII